MKILVGLGNPGIRYETTRHNIGFIIIDYFAEKLGVNIDKKKYNSLYCETHFKGEKIILLKPQTYMNLSGLAVNAMGSFFKAAPKDIIVIHDDLDIALGRLRFRPEGGAGGHNGIKNIIEELGTRFFNRLKIGIGRPPEAVEGFSYVLGAFNEEEWTKITCLFPIVVEALEDFIKTDINNVMNKYNSYKGE
jgi:PTH1 family peptidyl-tRNA hydrolase